MVGINTIFQCKKNKIHQRCLSVIYKFCDSICSSEGNLKKVNMTTGYQRHYDFDKEITGHIPYEPTYSYHIKSDGLKNEGREVEGDSEKVER